MSASKRMMVAAKIILGCGVAGIIHYRVFLPKLEPLATGQFSGPWNQPVIMLKSLVPAVLLVIVFGTLVWVLVGGIRKERKRDEMVRRRR
jgi:hypothetical protein